MIRMGVVTALAVRGRRSGKWRSVPVNVLEFDGDRYLVAPRGNTEWVRNLRVAGGGELRRRGKAESFTATEIPDAAKPPIIDAYLERWRGQVKGQFEALPNPEQHPVFRIEPDRGA
jgi:deazaflavin-dependent oxidoreductase (nitroreductase family)